MQITELQTIENHIKKTNGLSELELNARSGTVDRRIAELRIALERSTDLDLEGDLDTIVKKLSSLENRTKWKYKRQERINRINE